MIKRGVPRVGRRLCLCLCAKGAPSYVAPPSVRPHAYLECNPDLVQVVGGPAVGKPLVEPIEQGGYRRIARRLRRRGRRGRRRRR